MHAAPLRPYVPFSSALLACALDLALRSGQRLRLASLFPRRTSLVVSACTAPREPLRDRDPAPAAPRMAARPVDRHWRFPLVVGDIPLGDPLRWIAAAMGLCSRITGATR